MTYACDILHKNKGLNGDLDRLPMLTWIMLAKFLDNLKIKRGREAKLAGKRFKPAIKPPVRTARADGITSAESPAFINPEAAILDRAFKGES